MKIQVASDLHLEFLADRFPGYRAVQHTDADVLVLAGDIHMHDCAVASFANWPVPVILLNGNHEFYGSSPLRVTSALEDASARVSTVHYLEKRTWTYQNVRFLGCCLWTDYELYGAPDPAMAAAGRMLADHRRIRLSEDRPFMPRDARELHLASVAWLESQLSTPFEGKTVVCTHHGPTSCSTHADYANDPLNPCFMSNLDELVRQADLWIHGHVHNSFDYRLGRARVVANPRGYALNLSQSGDVDGIRWENPNFQPALIVEV